MVLQFHAPVCSVTTPAQLCLLIHCTCAFADCTTFAVELALYCEDSCFIFSLLCCQRGSLIPDSEDDAKDNKDTMFWLLEHTQQKFKTITHKSQYNVQYEGRWESNNSRITENKRAAWWTCTNLTAYYRLMETRCPLLCYKYTDISLNLLSPSSDMKEMTAEGSSYCSGMPRLLIHNCSYILSYLISCLM